MTFDYDVTITTTQRAIVSVEADSPDEARGKLDRTIKNNPEELDDYMDVVEESFTIIPADDVQRMSLDDWENS